MLDVLAPLVAQLYNVIHHASYYCNYLGNTWMVVTSSPQAAEFVFRAEGKYPSRGGFEDNMLWLYDKLKLPPTMFFS